jgi:phosphopantetheinyl transferase
MPLQTAAIMDTPELHAESTTALHVSVHRREAGAPGHAPASPQFLTAAEEAACARFLRPDDAALCRAARFLVRHTLSSLLGIAPAALRLRPRPGGKPELACAGLHSLRFNLSHTRGLAMLAVTMAGDAELGIDVECADRRVSADLVRAVLAPAELRAVLALPDERQSAAFLRLWTGKEAVLKAAGLGLAVAAERVVFDVAAMSLVAIPAELGEVADYTVRGITVPGPYHASLAVLDRRRRAVTVEVRPPL